MKSEPGEAIVDCQSCSGTGKMSREALFWCADSQAALFEAFDLSALFDRHFEDLARQIA